LNKKPLCLTWGAMGWSANMFPQNNKNNFTLLKACLNGPPLILGPTTLG